MASRARAEESKPMAAVVAETLEFLDIADEDRALAALAMKYAEAMDRAAAIAAAAARIPYDEDTAEEVKRLAARVSQQTTMSDLGPKLLAALDALQATPKARAANAKPAPKGPSKLDALRGAAT